MVRVFRILAVGFLTYGALVGALTVFQRHLMYFPDTHKPEPADFGVPEMAEVTLKTKDGLDLLAWYRAPQSEALPVILYFHGNAGHIAGEGIGARRTVFYGESLGSGVAVQLATEGTPGAVVLEAPFTSAADIAAKSFPFAPARYLVWDRFASIDKIGGVKAPLFFIHGERDRVVPVGNGRKLFSAAPEPKSARYFAGAGHNDLYMYGAAEEVIAFIRKTFGD